MLHFYANIMHFTPEIIANVALPHLSTTIFLKFLRRRFRGEMEFTMSRTTYKSDKVRTLVAVGMFSALAYVCCVMFHFKASFLTFDLKDAVMTVGAMMFGPLYGLAMAVIVALIEMVTISDTSYYGLIMNIISSVCYVCISSGIYCRRRTMTGAVVGVVSAVVGTTAVMMVANYFITPLFMQVGSAEVVALIPTLLLPFNLTKAVFNSAIVFVLYTPVSTAVRSAGFMPSRCKSTNENSSEALILHKKSRVYAVVLAVALIIAASALLYFFFSLKGSFSFL